MTKWQVIDTLKNECITDVSEENIRKEGYTKNAHRYSKEIGTEDFLILYAQIPDETETKTQGIAGIRISNTFLKDSMLTTAIRTAGWDADDSLTVTDMSGSVILGDESTSLYLNRITSAFDNNFPPWRIEVSANLTRPFLFSAIFRSFYFWTILAMMAILGFGIVIIGRTISHEKEVLKLKSDFVSSVSHEFKTPITSIKALTERLLEGTVKDEARMKEYYTVIAQDTESLSHLVGNILDIAKMEEGKTQYDIEETDFKEWLEETITNFFSRTTNRRFNIHIPETDPSIRVRIDKNAMKLAIINLLDNAVKFSPEDSEISVTYDKRGNRLMLKIMDDGIGISRNEQARIFEKFYRGKSALNHSATGTGLGLTIVKQIVEAHGGEILVESEPGRGSSFIVLLPLFT
jgi:signal transduction histidine kinase